MRKWEPYTKKDDYLVYRGNLLTHYGGPLWTVLAVTSAEKPTCAQERFSNWLYCHQRDMD